MYGQYGIEFNIANIYALAAPYIGVGERIVKMSDLKPAYVKFLKSMHAEFPIDDGNLLVRDPAKIEAFSRAFSASSIDDLQQDRMVGGLYDGTRFEANAQLLESSIAEISLLNPELAELLKLAVHAIILCDSDRNQEGFRAHGGSSSKCVGLIWLNLHDKMSSRDVIEMLIHELTHTLVFIDELNREHFDYSNLTKEPYWALSSILKRRRPMDKVVHSVIVSMEILYARRTYLPFTDETVLVHPATPALTKNVAASIAGVLDHPLLEGVCKPRTIELMRNAQSQLNISTLSNGGALEIAL